VLLRLPLVGDVPLEDPADGPHLLRFQSTITMSELTVVQRVFTCFGIIYVWECIVMIL
jgi:hypothetical protein